MFCFVSTVSYQCLGGRLSVFRPTIWTGPPTALSLGMMFTLAKYICSCLRAACLLFVGSRIIALSGDNFMACLVERRRVEYCNPGVECEWLSDGGNRLRGQDLQSWRECAAFVACGSCAARQRKRWGRRDSTRWKEIKEGANLIRALRLFCVGSGGSRLPTRVHDGPDTLVFRQRTRLLTFKASLSPSPPHHHPWVSSFPTFYLASSARRRCVSVP